MFWKSLTPPEAVEYYNLLQKISIWSGHCETCRKAKSPVQEDLRPTDQEFMRWNELFWKFWTK